jgi:predicted glutamine amidotransferase
MCRWLAYSGSPVLLDELLYKPKHSLIAQSLHSTLGAETTNGDGFGVGWYGAQATPGVFRGTEPAWSDRNLRELSMHVASPLVFAHIRASSGSAVRSRSLFHSTDVRALRHQYPDNPVLHEVSDESRLVVSEPLGDLKGAWREVPEATCVVISAGRDELRPFIPGRAAPDRSGGAATRR